jgi:copper chaperone
MQTKIHVDGMTCRHCEMSITNAISAMTGVGEVETDIQNGTIMVTHNESVSAETIMVKIVEIGFGART